MNISRRQESHSQSGTACIFPFKRPPVITYLPRAQYSWSGRDRDGPQAVLSQAADLRRIFICHFSLASPRAAFLVHRLHHPVGSLHTEGEVLPHAHWRALWAICLHLGEVLVITAWWPGLSFEALFHFNPVPEGTGYIWVLSCVF